MVSLQNVVIRPMLSGEFKAVLSLLQRLSKEEAERFGADVSRPDEALVKAREVIVAYDAAERQLVGVVLASVKTGGLGEVSWLYVVQEFRGYRIATRLLDAATYYLAKSEACERVQAFVWDGNEASERAFGKGPFRKIGTLWEVRP